MQRFEYTARLLDTSPAWNASLNEVLNALAGEGWELMSVVPAMILGDRPTWVFRRPAPESTESGEKRPGAAREHLEAAKVLALGVAHLLMRQERVEALKTTDYMTYWNALPEGERDLYVARAREVISLVKLSLKHN